MPLPDLTSELPDDVDLLREDEPQQTANLGANPWCSNCMDGLTMRGGILCKPCYNAIYVGMTEDQWELCVERAIIQGSVRVPDWTVGADAIPRERDGSPLNPRLCDTPGCLCDSRWGAFWR